MFTCATYCAHCPQGPARPPPCESREESHVTQSHNDWSAETTLFLTLVVPCFSDWIKMLQRWVSKVHVQLFAYLLDHLPQTGFRGSGG